MSVWSRSVDLIRYGESFWYKRWLKRALVDAQCALGQGMYTAGIDDGQLGAQIDAVDREIRQSEATGSLTRALVAQRRMLVLQLAAIALEEDAPLPGADAGYRKAREAQAALQAYAERKAAQTPFAGKVEPVAVGS